MVVARTARSRPLRWEERVDPFPLGVGQFGGRRCRGQVRDTRCDSFPGPARAVAVLGHSLVRPAPARPTEVEEPLRLVGDGGENETADLRNGQRDQRWTGSRSPF